VALCASQARFDLRKLPSHAAVVDRASDSGDDATNQVGIDSCRHVNSASCELRQASLDSLCPIRADRSGRRHIRADHFLMIENGRSIGSQDLGQQREAIALGAGFIHPVRTVSPLLS